MRATVIAKWILAGVFIAATARAQVIETSVLNLSLAGQWEPRPEWTNEQKLREKFAFFERSTGSLMHIQRYERTFDPKEISASNMQASETFWGEPPHPRFARFLVNNMFLFPASYHQEAGRYMAEAMVGRKTQTLYLWDLKGIEGDAHLFYMSQLTPRIVAVNVKGIWHFGEEYVPLRMTRAEKREAAKGEALVFEMESEKPATDHAVKSFQMPDSIKDQRIRYSLVMYAPAGFAAGPPISILVATPVSSSLDCDAILKALSPSEQQR